MAARRSMTPRESSKQQTLLIGMFVDHPTTRVLLCRIAAGFAGVVLHDRHGMYPCSCPGYTIIKHVCLGHSCPAGSALANGTSSGACTRPPQAFVLRTGDRARGELNGEPPRTF
jgi:hypothetical protein